MGKPGAIDLDTFHISRIGKLIEHNESNLRELVAQIYVTKQRHITNTGRLIEEYMSKDEKAKFQQDLAAAQASKNLAAAEAEVFR